MNYIKVEIQGKRKDRQSLEALLLENEIYQIEELSYDVLEEINKSQLTWDYMDPEALGVDKDELIFRFYLGQEEGERLSKIKESVQGASWVKIVDEVIEEEDWANNWKAFFHPISVNENLSIVPTWVDYQAKEKERVILMDPGMAFGSGSHETTFMCMTSLAKYVKGGERVFDIGCGSGILSLVARALGAQEVVGVDLDPVCVSASNHNIALNRMEDGIKIYQGDLFSVVEGQAGLIVSNLFAEVIVNMLDKLIDHLVSQGIFVASGILVEKKDLVIQALKSRDFTILESEIQGDWVCITAKAAQK